MALVRAATEVWVARGKKYVHWDMEQDAPADDEVLKRILGRSGTLRAPTLIAGKRMVVGFHAELYHQLWVG